VAIHNIITMQYITHNYFVIQSEYYNSIASDKDDIIKLLYID